jgi:hypothetical protein
VVRRGGLVGQKLGCRTALGCAGRACTRTRGLMHGARRVHPVVGGELGATAATRRGALCYHLQVNMLGSKPGSHTTSVLHGDGELGVRVAQKL